MAGNRVAGTGEGARLLDLAYDAIFAIDFATKQITYWNRGAEMLYGYGAEEALGRRSWELLKTVFPRSQQQVYEEVVRKRYWEGRLVQTRKDGETVVVDGRWAMDPALGAIVEINR